MRLFITVLVLSLLFAACKLQDEESEPVVYYSALQVQPSVDTIFLSANNESKTLSLLGTILNVSEKTISNTGVMTDAQFTVRQVDTSFQPVDAAKASWFSSNSSVASVSNGIVVARSAGYASISAGIGSTFSQSIVVNVRPVEAAPGLSLDPPFASLIFENSVSLSGTVQQQARLSVFEPNSGFTANNVSYSSSGSFGVTVTGLNPGVRVITARAMHATNSNLYTDRSKIVYYYVPGSAEANSIVGNWRGSTLEKQFNFTIENSIIPTRYDITGTIDIQFEGLGLVQGINLTGIINNNGTINVSLSKSHQGFSISGKLSGYFKTTGTGEGVYNAQAIKSGWPKISFNETWTAVKE